MPPTVVVCARKRPLNVLEIRAGGHDVVDCASPTEMVVEETRSRYDGAPVATRHSFAFDAVFDDCASTDAVYAAVLRPHALRVIEAPVNATLFTYGQTGG